ncbi:hypothetical protein BC829DRAFT_3518 [Chytridium lagenaria]|nr:hypothetical protein BC829DRAFT_3518 [Chytridium lagenaria]
MPKDPSGGSYPNPSSAAPIDPQMLVGLRWDFEEYSSAPISIANSAYSPSTELSESPERTTASYLWKRMMKKSPKKLTPQLSVPISTAPPPVNDESSLVMRRSSSIEVGSIIAEVGSREALDSRAEIPTIREPQSQSNASSNASNNITSAASGLYEKERSSSVLHHQLPSLFKSDSIHSSYSPSKANKRTSVRMESNLGKADTQSTTVSTVATPTHAHITIISGSRVACLLFCPDAFNPPDSPSPSVNRRKTKESRRSVVSKGDGSPQMERKITKASGGSVVSRTELPVACSFWKVGLSPNSTFFAVWEFIISLYYLLIIWIIPIMIAFDENQFQDQFSMLTTALFGVDAIIQMLTVRSDRVGNYTLKQWVLRYFANELLLDIVTVVPFDLIAFRGAEYFLFLRYLRTVKLSAILKKSPYYIKLRFFLEKKMGIGETYFGFLVLFTVIIISLHVQACAYWHAGRVAKFSSAPIKSVQNKTSTDQYAWGFFQGVGNTFPLIYQPENVVERWIVIVFAFINAVLYAVVVGSFSSYVVGLNASGRLYRQKIDELNEYMEWKTA